MRKILVLAFLGGRRIIKKKIPIQKSGAQKTQRQDVRTDPIRTSVKPLPDFDSRLGESGEFADDDISSTTSKQQSLRTNRARARSTALEQFRGRLNNEDRHNLRAVVNDTGAIKNLFVDGGALSEARSESVDNVARGFLKNNNELFALSSADVTNLQVMKEDVDQGTTFLGYVQTVGGLKVF